jgi:hypothetical protein
MSCKQPLTTSNTKLFKRILLCSSCQALAEKAEREITQRIEMAKQHSMNWLEQHILKGGLLLGGTGVENDVKAPGSPHAPQAPLSELSDAEANRDGAVPVAGRKYLAR